MRPSRWVTLMPAALLVCVANGARPAAAEVTCTPPTGYGVQLCTSGLPTFIVARAIDDTQYQSQWCWAASISNVFKYYGHPVSQKRVVAETYGVVANVPGTEAAMRGALNRTWTDDRGTRFTVRSDDVYPAQAAQELSLRHPLVVTTLGHAMVLTALTYERAPRGEGNVTAAIVRDPWPYNPNRRVLSAREWDSITHLFRIAIT
jgi:papain like cysteine protease AvrRpt2